MPGRLRSLASFLTIIPAQGSLEEAARAFHLAPLVTGLREALTGIVLVALPTAGLPPPAAAALALSTHLTLQGFHHFDGLVDAGEALLASRAGRDALEIMRDKHRGGFAIGVGAVYAIVLWSLLETLARWDTLYVPQPAPLLATIAAGAVSGASMYAALYTLPPPPYRGLGSLFKSYTSPRRLTLSLLLALLVPSLILFAAHLAGAIEAFWASLASLVVASFSGGLLTSSLMISVARRSIGYATGDVAGMVGELSFAGSLLSTLLVIPLVGG